MLVLPEKWLEKWKDKDAFEKLFALEGRVLRSKEGRRTLHFTFRGSSYYGKFHLGVGWREIVKNLAMFRRPVLGARNEWRAIRRVEGLGLNTLKLVGYGSRGRNPARIQSFIITEDLAHTTSLERFCRDWPESPPEPAFRRALIREVAHIARTLHENGINHRDLYLCHFMLDMTKSLENSGSKRPVIHLIDLHRARFHTRTPLRWRIKDLAGLCFSSMDVGLTRGDMFRFIEAYSGTPAREALGKEKRMWRRVKRRVLAMYQKRSQTT